MSGVAKTDPTKRRHTRNTPWSIYNPAWIKTRQRRKPVPETKRGTTDGGTGK